MWPTEYFHDSNDNLAPNHNNPFHNKNLWTPPSDRDSALNAYIDAVRRDNLTPHEGQALRKTNGNTKA